MSLSGTVIYFHNPLFVQDIKKVPYAANGEVYSITYDYLDTEEIQYHHVL